MTDRERGGLSRRAMLRGAAIAGMGAGLATAAGGTAAATPAALPAVGADENSWPTRRAGAKAMMDKAFEPMPNPRFGIIGAGNRGAVMVPMLLAVPGAQITAIADTRGDTAQALATRVTDAGRPAPAVITGNERSYEQLLTRDDVDFVYIATPWEFHASMALAAMRAGKHVGVECPLAVTIQELWDLVDTSEQTGKHCLQLENCLYGRHELRLMKMVADGRFGSLLTAAGAYQADLRSLLFSDTHYAGEWRRAWQTKMDSDLYPTHGLGPVASYLGIHRGDRFARISTMSSPAVGLEEFRAANVAKADSSWEESYVKGDITQSLLQTERGRVVHLKHGISSPHPYTRLNHLYGSKGAFEDFPARIYLEPDHSDQQWKSFDAYQSYDHWLWTDVGPRPAGYDGMDYLLAYRLVQCMQLGLPPDMDVYDSATWSAPVPLGAISIRNGGASVDFPDFTRGGWQQDHQSPNSVKP